MPDPAVQHPTPPLFGDHDYELAYGPRGAWFEVRIKGRLATPPVVGDVYTLDRGELIHDLVVTEVSRDGQGGWSARCRAQDAT